MNTIGADCADAVVEVAALCAVWVSHKHADHCLGLPALIAARPATCRPLLVIGPWAVREWLAEVRAAFPLAPPHVPSRCRLLVPPPLVSSLPCQSFLFIDPQARTIHRLSEA